MTKQRKKVELPPKFEIAQLIAFQLGIGFVALYHILRVDGVVDVFKTIPNVLIILKIINALCAFTCIAISGGKIITYYEELRDFIKAKKKENE
jgi:hypothetical protein